LGVVVMKVLGISPHVDDIELGAGGYIARLLEEGHEVFVLAFSIGNPDTGSDQWEFLESIKTLGVKNSKVLAYPCRGFDEHRQDILDFLIAYKDEHVPDLVLVPSQANIHQDHEVVTQEAMRAFRTCSILGYEMPWGDLRPFHPQFYARLTIKHLNLKLSALQQYKSQLSRQYVHTDTVAALAVKRGMQVRASYAEAFEVIRWIF
jgi:LmbE family N-acetylglucosaminyl deacetylase